MNEQKIQGKIINAENVIIGKAVNSEQIKGKICTTIDYIINSGIDTSDATAVENDVLYGKTAYGVNGKFTGSMLNNGAVSKTLDALTVSYTISEGYHNGNGKVNIVTETKSVIPTKSTQTINPTSGKVLSSVSINPIPDNYIDTSDATAVASNIQSGKTAYVNGSKITGTHTCDSVNFQSKSVTPSETAQTVSPDSGYDGLSSVSVGAISNTYIGSKVTKKPAATYTPNTTDQTIANGQYLSGVQTIKGDANLVASNIKNGVSIFGVNGTYTPTLQSKTVTPTKSSQTISPDTNYDGLSSVIVDAIPDNYIDTSDADATENYILENKTAYVNGQKITGILPYTDSGDGRYYYDDGVSKTTAVRNNITYLRFINDFSVNPQRAFLTGSKCSIDIPLSEFGDATASDVVNGKTFTSTDGLVITGTHVCSGGIDTSDATATASDIASGKTAYINGEKITGSISVIPNNGTNPVDNCAVDTVSGKLRLKVQESIDRLYRAGATIEARTAFSNFGNATASDVTKGKTFTSSAGLKVTGTFESGSSDNNCEAYIVDVTNPVVNFKTTTGTIKAWGYALGTTSGYTTPRYGFVGTQYKKVSSYGSDTTTDMTLLVDSSGNLTGLPSDLASGTILVTIGI